MASVEPKTDPSNLAMGTLQIEPERQCLIVFAGFPTGLITDGTMLVVCRLSGGNGKVSRLEFEQFSSIVLSLRRSTRSDRGTDSPLWDQTNAGLAAEY
jgi:hypothetical protein